MVSRADVAALSRATTRITDEANRTFRTLFSQIDVSDYRVARALLQDVVPAISDVYGSMAAEVAAQWYEGLRLKEVGDVSYTARLGEPLPRVAVESGVRWASEQFWGKGPQSVEALLSGALQRYVMSGARDTVARNVRLDPAKPRFAVVPTDTNPCAWCVTMASRGWVYTSRESAEKHSGFHDNCKCQVVPSFDADDAYIKGYDPDRYYALYKEALEPGASLKETVVRMRHLHPDLYGSGK